MMVNMATSSWSRLGAAAVTLLLAAAPLPAQQPTPQPKPSRDEPKATAEPHLLRYRFLAGTTWSSVITQASVSTVGEAPGTATVKTTIRMTVRNEVRDAGGGRAFLDTRIQRVEFEADTPLGPQRYDSDDRDAAVPTPFAAIAQLASQQHTMIVTDRGEVVSSKLRAEVPEQLRQSGLDVEQLIAQSVIRLPEQPIAIGGEWHTTETMPLGQLGEADSRTTYRLRTVTGSTIELEQKVELDTERLQLPADTELGKIEIAGTHTIDMRSGLPVRMRMQSSMSVRAAPPWRNVLTATIEPLAAKPPGDAAADNGR